jgi:type II secretory pathway component PulF
MNNIPSKPFFLRFSVREQIVFSKRLGMIMRSGTPVREALLMLDTQHNTPSASYVLGRVIADVSRGQTLSVALSSFASIFGVFAIHMIRVGEVSGTLHHNLSYLAEELKKKDALRKKVMGALVYPLVIVCATIAISTVLTVYIFPKITPIFQSFKHQLPLMTRILIALSSFLIVDGIWLLLFLVMVSIALYFLLQKPSVKRVVHRLILYLPLVGTVSRYYNLAMTARTLSLLLKGEVRIVEALSVVADSTQQSVYRECLYDIASAVARGKLLSAQMGKYPELFPLLATQMIAVGEDTGDLAGALMYISDMYEEEINDLTHNLTVLLEPILMLVMGFVVGFIAISIITPIYGITQDLTPH